MDGESYDGDVLLVRDKSKGAAMLGDALDDTVPVLHHPKGVLHHAGPIKHQAPTYDTTTLRRLE